MPLYPKPRKGKTLKNNYSTVVDSIVRPNLTYAQATNTRTQINNKNTQQMAPRSNEVPAITQQAQANRNVKSPLSRKTTILRKTPSICHNPNPSTNHEYSSYTNTADCCS
ncbi:hypothetical protein TNCV_4280101 [Trichonephila clavipes]|nr:hypothetical protein TNCV_4280101 [Trichonephila clavipes]